MDQDSAIAPSSDFAGVRITEEVIASLSKGAPTFSLPRPRIRAVVLRHGFQAERPILQSLFGAALALGGLVPIWEVVLWFQRGGTIYDVIFMLLPLFPAGLLLCLHGLRRGYYLSVRLTDDRFKIPFRRKSGRDDIERFLRDTATRVGYDVRVEV